MIIYKDLVSNGVHTTGFNVTIENQMTLKVEAGSFVHLIAGQDRTFSFPEFEFDVEADDELVTIYDVYLLEDNNIHIDRTEIGLENLPGYDGEVKMIHNVITFEVLPGIIDLNDIEISVRNFIDNSPIEESDPDEN